MAGDFPIGTPTSNTRASRAADLRVDHDLDHVLQGLRDAILWEAEADTLRFSFVSESAVSILGYPVRQWLSEAGFWGRHIHPDDREETLRLCREASERSEGRGLEYRMVAADGGTVWLRDRAWLVAGPTGEVQRLCGLLVDITEHKHIERRLFVQYAVTKILAEANTLDQAAPEIIEAVCSGLDWDLGQLWVAEPGRDVLTLRESRGLPSLQAAAFQEDSRRRAFERGVGLPGRVWASAEPHWISDLAQDPNFPRAPFAVEVGLESGFAFPIRFGAKVLGVMEFFSRHRLERDDDLLDAFASLGSQIGQFLERERVQAALRVSEERYRTLVEEAPVVIYSMAPDGTFTDLSPAFERITGWSATDWLGRSFSEIVHADDLPLAAEQVATALQAQTPPVFEVRIRSRSGEYLLGEIRLQPKFENGEVVGTFGTAIDVTERRRAEEELRQSEERLRVAMDAGGMGAWDWNVLTGQVRWSEGLEVMHGLAPGTFGGTFEAFLQDVHPDDRDVLVASIQEALTAGTYDVEYRMLRPPDGAVRWLAAKGQVLYDEGGQPVRMLGVCTDLTDRKNAADRERFLAEAGAVLASSLDYDTVLDRLANLIVGNMADWCYIDLIEQDGSVRRLILAYADPSKQDVARMLEQYVPDTTWARARAVVEALSRGKALLYPEVSEEQLAAAALDETHYQLMRDLGLKSAMVVPLLARGKLLGAITFVFAESGRHYAQDDVALAEDLAHRAALAVDNARLYGESQRVQQELRKANEAKDEFLGLVSHELRTPITTIYGGARLLRWRGDTLDEESKREVVQDIASETERLHRIVENLLALARVELGQEVVGEPVLFQRSVNGLVKSFAERNPGRPVECDVDPELPPVAAEATYLEQVLRNLLSNADKYSPPGRPIEVRAESCDGEAIVRVLDRGPGIQPEEAESIFERFYRSPDSERMARGMGLGLTVCKRLIEAQAGRIWARPRDGGGLEVGFALPLCDELSP